MPSHLCASRLLRIAIRDVVSGMTKQDELAGAVRVAEADLQRLEWWHQLGQAIDPAVLAELRAKLEHAENALAAALAEDVGEPMIRRPRDHDPELGPETTKLQATVTMRMDRLATGMAHLYALRRTPLVSVRVENFRNKVARVAVRCHIEGYSAHAIESAEIPPKDSGNNSETFDLFPPLFPERIRTLTELTAGSLHVVVEDLDAGDTGIEVTSARPIAMLPPTTAILSYRDPKTGKEQKQYDLLAAWVTPGSQAVLHMLRTSTDLTKLKAMRGYQSDAAGVRDHVRAIYDALKAAEFRYISSVFAFGGGEGQSLQRVRLPRESIEQRSANCIDSTVLMASLLEATGIDPLIVIVPGHAFLGFRHTPKFPDLIDYVETTMLSTHSFEDACKAGAEKVKYAKEWNELWPLVDVRKLRESGITPME